MAGYVRLQPLTLAAVGASTQRIDAAVDVGEFGAVVAQIRTAVAGGTGSVLVLQHAAVLEDSAFNDCAQVAIDVAGSQAIVLPPLLRYVRWRASVATSAARFQIDLVGREAVPFSVVSDLKVGTSTFTGLGTVLEVGSPAQNGFPALYVKTKSSVCERCTALL